MILNYFDRCVQRNTHGKHCVITVFHFCQTEIENLGVAALGDKNVCRLNVAMDNAFGMGGVEGFGDFDAKGQYSF